MLRSRTQALVTVGIAVIAGDLWADTITLRNGEKIEFAPHQAQRFKERSTVERVNARLKDDFGVCRVNVRGHTKVLAQMTFAVLALTADQLLRWVT